MRKYLFIIAFHSFGLSVSAQSSLEDYWQMAAENNPSLKAKFNRYLSALEKVNQQNALPDPNLSFGYFISPVETRVGAQRFRFSVSQMFPWMGTLNAREDWAVKMAEASFAEFESARNSLFLNLSETWLQLSELEQEISITKQNLNLLKTYEPIAKTKYEANLGSLADLIRVQIRIEEATTQLELLELKKTPIISDFNTSLNRPIDNEVVIILTDLKSTSNINLDSALLSNPKVSQNQLMVQAAESQIELSELKRKPNIGVGLDYVIVSKRSDVSIPDNGKDVLMPMISMSLPIFGRKNQSQKKEAELYKESLINESVSIQNDIKNEWTKAEYLEASSAKELDLYERELKSTQSLLNVLTSEYSNNSSNFEELLMVQQKLLQLQIAQLKSQTKSKRASFIKKYLSGNFLNPRP